ncbi:IL27B protein, partial [Menura novaehollandiae]|nr:IL27B protein [Menura novaehollandiae]
PAIECWASSYPQAVNCSWGLSPEPLLDTNFEATYRSVGVPKTRLGPSRVTQPWPAVPVPRHGPVSGECTLTGPRSCSFGDLQVFSLTPYVLNVTARNPLGAASGMLPFLLENIIKPDPPEALQVSPIPGEPRKLLLEWSPPASWPFPEYFPLQYRIRYSRDNDSVPTTVGPFELTSHTLRDLEPGTLLHIQVAAKDLADSGEFSAWSPPASGTPWVGP